jgi:hypothetical protein
MLPPINKPAVNLGRSVLISPKSIVMLQKHAAGLVHELSAQPAIYTAGSPEGATRKCGRL